MKKKIKKPKCFKDDRFIYCYCGKCKPENYPMPKDLRSTPERLSDLETERIQTRSKELQIIRNLLETIKQD